MTATLDLLDRVKCWWTTYLAFQSDQDADLMALWTLHSHVYRQGWTTPRLVLQSVRRGSGKSTALEHLQRLAGGDPVRNGSVPSRSLLVRDAGSGSTLLFDEIDKWPNGEDRRAVFGVLNDGFSADGSVRINEPTQAGGWEPRSFEVFAPVAMAGLHRYGDVPEDVWSRALTVHLTPAERGDYVKTRWSRLHGAATDLHAEIVAWAGTIVLPDSDPSPELDGRRADVWEPILRVAKAAGNSWVERVEAMIEAEIVGALERGDEERLLLWQRASKDTYIAWLDPEQPLDDLAPTREILDRLHHINPMQWRNLEHGHLTTKRYADLMAEGGVRPVRFYLDGERVRGYRRSDHHLNWHHLGLLDGMGNPVPVW